MPIISIIGAGNMGGAIAKGILENPPFQSMEVRLADQAVDQLKVFSDQYSVTCFTDNKEAVAGADYVILALKPAYIEAVIQEIKASLSPTCLLVSIATSLSLEGASKLLGSEQKFARVMPNTPAQVGAGMAGIVCNERLDADDRQGLHAIFSSLGQARFVTEDQLNTVTALSGSGPALMYMMLEAMADAAVLTGMGRQDAYDFASQTMLGAAQMAQESQLHPGQLKDMVCTPAGTTIAEVQAAEALGLRTAMIESLLAGYDKAKELANT
ncbi:MULTISPECIES: pyrroline-5-carboxylate reductase [Aerococcus]|uniref:Pyrroline-5-carboxylate reductase n=1 Tax=Aerococcus sanguinicola TaxID=119206 RepID=A0A5N1GDN6_9LACT|nr:MULTISPECIES: pyrroline-5-carboxylate reductase [Aerococcus]KAA9299045.1 pyrroline-5-carboxylate reductase [Aerococcus sanguinicola]MDK6369181.1 pyrroline-5-carboxylate reductase [Aerococcus sp. UMB9870]MDK6680767.1 pyrroline-5-carboxylate reductase [Aerococcus sp. UMB8608]MDK6687631.1 pyrroline-5-carboxylate reductase [Aerococcus sp. UMB8623]MDK6940722.1 pyrroline-5-carboxylate reductase [Aerococcus sp. UMB8487]